LLSLLGHQERRIIHNEETTGQTYKVRVGSETGGSTLHVSLNHESNRPGELIEVYARMGKPGAIEAGLFEAVGRLASAFLQYAAEFGEDERAKAEQSIVRQLVNIQSGYPAFFKFGDSEKSVVIQSPCDGLAKAIQQYRRQFTTATNAETQPTVAPVDPTGGGSPTVATSFTVSPKASSQAIETFMAKASATLGACKCGSTDWLKIDGCLVCQGCSYSKCG
jgi:hypothetical protein